MIIRTYRSGSPSEQHYDDNQSGLVEIVLKDGRTLQVSLSMNGDVFIRGWGNIPATLGNWNKLELTTNLQFEKPTTDPLTFDRLPVE
jgi:hypothetical protein